MNTPRYVLITRAALSEAFTPLVERRTRQGFETALVTVEQISQDYNGRDIQEQIRECIRSFYDPSVSLFVALGGDAVEGNIEGSIVPVRYCHPRSTVTVPADLYYSDMDGGTWDTDNDGLFGEPEDITLTELTPDICLGRIPVRTPEQARAYIDKVVLYEEAPLDGFANSLIFIRGTSGDAVDLTGDARPADFLNHDPVTHEEVEHTRYYTNNVQPFWQAVPLVFFFNTRGPLDQFACGDDNLTRERFIEQLSEGNEGRGYHIIRYGGHGNCYSMGLGREGLNIGIRHVSQLTNSIPGIMIGSSCSIAGFDNCESCSGEAFIRNPHGGTVAFFAAARSSSNNAIKDEVLAQIFIPESLYLGEIMKRAQTAGVPNYVNDPYKPYIYTFLGDPAIKRLDMQPVRKVQVFQPRGCEVIDVGADVTIRWNAVGTDFDPSEKVKLEYSDDSGHSWFAIPGAEELPFDGRYFVWYNCPLPEGTHYRIRVSCLSHPDVQHCSRRDFSVANVGLMTVLGHPYTGMLIAGTHGSVAEYTHSVTVGQTVTLLAPQSVGGLDFQGWLDRYGDIQSNELEFQFEFTGNSTIIASYGYPSRRHYYINDDKPERDFAAGNDLNDGLSLYNPKRHINALLSSDPSIGAGDVIHLSAGIYMENVALGPKNSGLVIVGAGSNLTEINGQHKAACINISQCDSVTLRGICLTQGSRGIYCDGSTCMITNCDFIDNSTSFRGGGLWCNQSRVILSRCAFTANQAKRGGAILLKYHNNVLMSGCKLEANRSSQQGGGIYIRENNDLKIINGLIAGNTGSTGGGLYVLNKSSVKITNSTFEGNVALNGSALYSISSDAASNIQIRNCIIWNAGLNPIVGPENLRIEYSDVQGGWLGEGNINANPCFARMGSWSDGVWFNGDYHLLSSMGRWDPIRENWNWLSDETTSPCIDRGSEDSDWCSEMEPNGGRINMGFYGGTAEASMSTELIE